MSQETPDERPCRGLALVSRLEDLVDRDRDHDCEGFGRDKICVKVAAVAALPTRYGDFRIVAFWNNRDEEEHELSCTPVHRFVAEILDGTRWQVVTKLS